MVFPGSAVINEVQVGRRGVASPAGTPLEVTAAGSQRIVMQGGSYRNTPYGGVGVCVGGWVLMCVCVSCVYFATYFSFSDSVLPPSQVLTEGSGQVSMEPFSSFHVGGQSVEEGLSVSQASVMAQGPDTVSQLMVDGTLTTNEVRSTDK